MNKIKHMNKHAFTSKTEDGWHGSAHRRIRHKTNQYLNGFKGYSSEVIDMIEEEGDPITYQDLWEDSLSRSHNWFCCEYTYLTPQYTKWLLKVTDGDPSKVMRYLDSDVKWNDVKYLFREYTPYNRRPQPVDPFTHILSTVVDLDYKWLKSITGLSMGG